MRYTGYINKHGLNMILKSVLFLLLLHNDVPELQSSFLTKSEASLWARVRTPVQSFHICLELHLLFGELSD